MNKSVAKEKILIGKRVQQLRKLLSLKQKELAEAISVSEPTIYAIESGKRFTGDQIIAISHFFGMTLNELTLIDAPLPEEFTFRKKLEELHQSQNSTAYQILINNVPYLKEIIKSRLISSGFFDTEFKSITDIKIFLKDVFGISYKSAILSEAISKAYFDGLLIRKRNGRNWSYKNSK